MTRQTLPKTYRLVVGYDLINLKALNWTKTMCYVAVYIMRTLIFVYLETQYSFCVHS